MTVPTDTISKSNTMITKVMHRWRPLRQLHSPWLMWSVAISFVFFQFFLQLSTGVMISQLMISFHLTALGAGFLAGSFYLIYVLLQTPAGMLVDKFGARRLLASGGLICGTGCLLFAVSKTVTLAFLGRLVMGAGASCAFVSSLYLVQQWFPERRFAMMVGLVETLGMLGALVGNIYLANVLSHGSWRNTMISTAWISFFLGLLCYVIVRDKSKNDEDQTITMDTTTNVAAHTVANFYKDVIWIIRHPGLWLNGVYTGLMFTVVTVFAGLWVLPYLVLSQHIPLPLVTFESALIFIGVAIGAPIMGWLYPRLKKKNHFLALTAVTAAFLSSWIIYDTPVSVSVNAVLFLLLGIACSSYVFNYSLANQLVPKHVRSTSIGFTNTLCLVTAPLLQPLVGWLLHIVSAKPSAVTTEIYTISNYHWALSVIPVSLLISAVIALYLPKPNTT